MTVLRRIGWGLAGLALAVVGLWVAALMLLQDAPHQAPVADRAATGRRDVSAGRAVVLGVPVQGVSRTGFVDSWGDPRENGLRQHHGTDIMAPPMTPVISAAPGTIEKLFQSNAGGTTIYVRSPDRRWLYYYAHLAAYASELAEGQAVRAGDLLAFVGDTGDAGPGNYHLHFGLTRTAPDQHWYQGTDVDPYPYLTGKMPLR